MLTVIFYIFLILFLCGMVYGALKDNMIIQSVSAVIGAIGCFVALYLSRGIVDACRFFAMTGAALVLFLIAMAGVLLDYRRR